MNPEHLRCIHFGGYANEKDGDEEMQRRAFQARKYGMQSRKLVESRRKEFGLLDACSLHIAIQDQGFATNERGNAHGPHMDYIAERVTADRV